MVETYTIAALWIGLAAFAAVLAYHLRISIALTEICVGIAFAAFAEGSFGVPMPGADENWLRFLASAGAVVLTFLAGSELEVDTLKSKWREVSVVGMIGFLAPFIGCTLIARFALGWGAQASWLAGVALSTTSMAVVYAVLLETGLNRTQFGKGVLGSCFVNDLGTVLALGLIFAPFTWHTAVFIAVSIAVLAFLPFLTDRLTHKYAHRTAAIRTKWVLFVLFGLGALALWSGSEPVLPAYLIGIVLSSAAARDHHWVRRLRTLTLGFLTPFYFIRAGALVSVPAILAAPAAILFLLGGKVLAKIFGLYPAIARFRAENKERWYYTLLMSTGLTFGSISALYGLTNGIISREQYSSLVAVVIASALIPTLIASWFFLPTHLLGEPPVPDEELPELSGNGNGGDGEEDAQVS